jgi:uncharacterized membrane protein YoaK (UPF0700 family)
MTRAPLLESTEDKQVVLLVVLTAVSGIIDSASYLGLDRVFTSNMTGNWVVLAFALSGAKGIAVARLGLSFVGFLAGAIIAGRLARFHWGKNRDGWPFALTVGLVFSAVVQLIAMLIWVAEGTVPSSADLLAFLLATSMGCQGGAVRLLGVADLPTVVITSTVTGLSGDSLFGTGHLTRWRRRAGAVAAFFSGGLVGAGIGRLNRPVSLVAGIAILVGVAGASQRLFPPAPPTPPAAVEA